MTNEEIAALVAESTKSTIEAAQSILEENKRLTAENEKLRNPKPETPELASDEEINKVMASLGLPTKHIDKPKTDHDKEIDNLLYNITPWMR